MKRIEQFGLSALKDNEGVYAKIYTSEVIVNDNWVIISTDRNYETLYAEEAEHFLTKYNLIKVDNKGIHIIKDSYFSESEHELSDSEKNKYSKPQYSIEIEQRKRGQVLIVIDNWSYNRRAETSQKTAKRYLGYVNWDISKLEWNIYNTYYGLKAQISIKK